MPLALLAVIAMTLAACGDTTSTYTPVADPIDYQQQELDAAIEESLEGVDTSELAILEET